MSFGTLSYPVQDALLMTKRNLLHYVRVPQLILYTVIQPIMFTLLFAYVFGGAIATPGGSYVNFLIPGIVIQTVVFGAMGTGIKLAEDMQKGIMDRFRSLPIARGTVLAARTLTDTMWNGLGVLIMVAVGYAIGYRFAGSPLDAVLFFGLAVLFAFTFSWVGATVGLIGKSSQAAEMLGFTVMFPIVFISSIFVPVQTMPDWLRVIAAANPMTKAADAVRALSFGQPLGNAGIITVLWCIAILAVFAPLAILRYKRLG